MPNDLATRMATIDHAGNSAVDKRMEKALIEYGAAVRRRIAEQIANGDLEMKYDQDSLELIVEPRELAGLSSGDIIKKIDGIALP